MAVVFSERFKDISGFSLWADGPVEGRKARLVLSFRDGRPRIVVYTGAMIGKDGMIVFPTDLPNFAGVVNTIKDMIRAPNGDKKTITSKTPIYENDKATNKLKILSTLHIGKSQEGVIYLALIDEAKPKIFFPIKPNEYHEFRNKDGSLIPDNEMSIKMTAWLCDVMLGIVSEVIVRHSEEQQTGADTGQRKGAVNIDLNKKTSDFELESSIEAY